jgi:LysR family nitrogen assimilation transcriptional regulator
MELRQLKYFIAVAECRSFNKAAEILFIAQPALSRQISSLEDELGVQLFVRSARGVHMTAAGIRFMEMARHTTDYIGNIKAKLQAPEDALTGSVTVGLPPSLTPLLAPRVLAAAKEQFPLLAVRIIEGQSTFISEWLELGRIDFALLTSPTRTRSITSREILDEEMVLVGSPGALGTSGGFLGVEELPRFRLAVTHGFRRVLEHWLLVHRVEIAYAMELDSIHVVLELARAGECCTVAPVSMVHDSVVRGSLSALRFRPPVTRVIASAVSARRPVSPAIAAVESLITDEVMKLPMELPA